MFFTHNSELLKYSNARWIPGGGVWIGGNYGLGQIKIFEKSKLVSIVSSEKRVCPLHEFRLEVLQAVKISSNVDVLGTAVSGWVPIQKSLEDYMFSIVIENFVDDLYFTEKINNCFATGTIPIYFGARRIDKIYNSEGIIVFNDVSELLTIINKLSKDEYYKRIKAVKQNHEICKQFISIEDYIFINYLSKKNLNKFNSDPLDFLSDNLYKVKAFVREILNNLIFSH